MLANCELASHLALAAASATFICTFVREVATPGVPTLKPAAAEKRASMVRAEKPELWRWQIFDLDLP